jgi:hypothetical protein
MDNIRLPGRGNQPASQSLGEVVHDIQSAFHNRPDNRADVGALLELYGSITSLCARSERIRTVLVARSNGPQSNGELVLDDLRPEEVHEFQGFYRELLEFGRCLTEVNLAAIDIYFPGLRDDLLHAACSDMEFSDIYVEYIAPKYGLADRELPSTLVQVLDRHRSRAHPINPGGQLMLEFDSNVESNDPDRYYYPKTPTQISIPAMLHITELLEACRGTIRSIVRENWDFRDLLDRGPMREGGIYVAKAEYNVSGSQVGAIGPGAHVHDVTFNQQVASIAAGIDAVVLAEQLERLQAELAKQASERDHYVALIAVSDAAADARQGRTSDALSKLAAVGRWVSDIASKIGVTVAVEAINRATGLG